MDRFGSTKKKKMFYRKIYSNLLNFAPLNYAHFF